MNSQVRDFLNKAFAPKKYTWIEKAILVIFIFVFTFPAFKPDLAPGLDSSYIWGLNWLFANDYAQLTSLIYPIGPLALLKLPTLEGYNFIIFVIVFSILKLWFIDACFRLAETHSHNIVSAAVITTVASFFAGFDIMIVFLCIMLCLRFLRENNWLFFILSGVLGFVGLFVKTSIGVAALSVLFVAWLVDFYNNRNIKRLLIGALTVLAIAVLMGIIVLHHFSTLIAYYWGVFHLVTGYGGALSLPLDNNWLVLSVFLVVMLAFPFLTKDKESKIVFLIALIPFFASWKHAFVREDLSHYKMIINFVVVLWCVILLSRTTRRWIAMLCAALSVMMLYCNMKIIPNYNDNNEEKEFCVFCGINNFADVTFGYKDFKERTCRLTDEALACEKLPDEVVAMIGNATIDIYPWEHTYAKVNGLNWHPRKTVEIGASTSKWLSDLSAAHFSGENAVNFVLWHFEKDGFTIDGRYPLNDEPLVVFNILQNYAPEFYGDNYVLFARENSPETIRCELGRKESVRFDEWIDVPDCADHILRVKVESSVSFVGFLKKTFFKDEMYYIDYLTDDGEEYSYRYVPSTAVDGLWVNPLVTKFVEGELAPQVKQIRFRTSGMSCVKNELSIQFETLFVSLGDRIRTYKDSSIALYANSFESDDPGAVLEPQGFSATYAIDMDSLWRMVADSTDIRIKASCRYLNKDKSQLVISIEGNEEPIYECDYFGKTGTKHWEQARVDALVSREKHPHGLLKVYVWNFGDHPTYIDDLKVSFVKIAE